MFDKISNKDRPLNKIKLALAFCIFILISATFINNKFLENEQNSINIFQNISNSIVHVSNMKSLRNVFNKDEAVVEAGVGSGFVWDNLGHIITSYHVIYGGDSFLILFKNDKKQYKARLIGSDSQNDIAVLKLDVLPSTLNPITIGESNDLKVGQKALAIGNPLGLDHTLTTGTISALNRKIRGAGGISIQGMIQTDASINPGNSGGALLDSQGKLIGVNSMIYNAAGSQASSGLGFAIPVEIVKKIVPQIIKFGKVIRPSLGIIILEDYYALQLGVTSGVMIKFADSKGPAGKAGLKGVSVDQYGQYYLGDIITGLDNLAINDYDELLMALEKYNVGDKVKIKYLRDHKERATEIVLIQM